MKSQISAKGVQIAVVSDGGHDDYISLTDIAFEFASWISPEFKLYIITDYQRLKGDENSRLSLNWNMNREIAKINYRIRIHTDAVKEHLIVPELPKQYQSFTYATEADVLNVAMFGKTVKQWREENPELTGNIRDQATLQQLIVLSNMESLNAERIKRGMSRDDRLMELNRVAKKQMRSMVNSSGVMRLKSTDS